MHVLSMAVQYLEQGYSVIPIHSKTKKPAVQWLKYQTERAPLERLEIWAEKTDTIGVVTGKISGITVVDIDVKYTDKTPLTAFPETYTVQTPSGGYHLYYRYSSTVQTGSNQFLMFPHVDIRNDGGYVVAPPSPGYTIINDVELAPFPVHLFGEKKKPKLRSTVNVTSGNRNSSITSAIGTLLLGLPEDKWGDAWDVVVSINKTYSPPLSPTELKTTFESIANKERTRRSESILSPIQPTESETVRLRLRKNKSNIPHKDLANAEYALANHKDYATAFRYDTFRRTIVFNAIPLRDVDVLATQRFLQTEIELSNVSRQTVADAIEARAHALSFNSAHEWLKGLQWDGVPRIDTWLTQVFGVPDDEYHNSVGSNWLRAMVQRIVYPGSKYDHVLVIEGEQGVRKTTAFSVLGGAWHTETSVQAESKDFLMQFNGKAIVEFSEGDTLTRSETKTLKSIITRTVDKYRAPYARSDEEHPRQCVFCMTTNDSEYLKDETGNRRWLPVKMPKGYEANIEWLKENREQLFAEAYARVDEPTWNHPKQAAEAYQDERRITDSWEDDIFEWYSSLSEKSRTEGVRIKDVYAYLNRDYDRLSPIDKPTEWRIKSILKGALRLESVQKMVNGTKARWWIPTEKTPKVEEF